MKMSVHEQYANNSENNRMTDSPSNNAMEFGADYLDEDTNILDQLCPILRQDIIACDFTLCLAISAIKSLRVDQIFYPRPRSIQIDNQEDIVNLRELCDNIPPLVEIARNKETPNNILRFLYWLFITVRRRGTYLATSYSELYPGYNPKIVQPNFIFNVFYTEENNRQWQLKKQNKKTFHAFHGSALENFYSILQTGLQYPMFDTKCRLYGDGIYLSTDLTMCFLYSPFWSSWLNSCLKGQYSVIACCEIINDEKKVLQEGVSVRTEMDRKIAQKYVVVTDPSMIRISHFLVYGKPTNFLWVQKNIFLIVIFLYIMMLLYIGLFGSQKNAWFKYLYAMCTRLYTFDK